MPDVPDRTNRTFALGVRALRTDASGRWFLNLGGDLMSVEERVERLDKPPTSPDSSVPEDEDPSDPEPPAQGQGTPL